MLTLQELLNSIRMSNPKIEQLLQLVITVNGNVYLLYLCDYELRESEAEGIIRQAFPFCSNILDSDVSIESIKRSEFKTDTTARVIVNIPKELPYGYFRCIVEDIFSKSTDVLDNINRVNELYAHSIASLLFTFFHGNQIEEFNSTWESMYTNWKKYEVNKI